MSEEGDTMRLDILVKTDDRPLALAGWHAEMPSYDDAVFVVKQFDKVFAWLAVETGINWAGATIPLRYDEDSQQN